MKEEGGGGGLPWCHGGLKHETLLQLVAVGRDQAGEQLMVSSDTRGHSFSLLFYDVDVSVPAHSR